MRLDHITSSCLTLDNTSIGIRLKQHHTRYVPPYRSPQDSTPAGGNQRERARPVDFPQDRDLHPLPGDHSAVAPPDPIPNSEVKRSRADGSVQPHARVGHRQGLTPKPRSSSLRGFSLVAKKTLAERTVRALRNLWQEPRGAE